MKTRTIEKLTLSTTDAAFAQSLYRVYSLDGCVKVGEKIYKVESFARHYSPKMVVDAVLVPYAEEVYAIEPEPTGPTITDLIGQGYLAVPTMTLEWESAGVKHKVFSTGNPQHQQIPKAAQWDGEGLPPVGVDCEVLWSSTTRKYVTCRVVGHDESSAVFRYTSGERKGEYQCDSARTYGNPALPCFRPIKTAEQLAAEQREAEITRFAEDITAGRSPLGSFEHSKVVATWLYDNDYRKVPK